VLDNWFAFGSWGSMFHLWIHQHPCEDVPLHLVCVYSRQ
jgi:hypothetical protein